MEVSIRGDAQEIAALVLLIQERRLKKRFIPETADGPCTEGNLAFTSSSSNSQ